MNEYSILMKLLTRSGNPIGASVEDMLDALGLHEDIGRHLLFQKLGALSRQISRLGLEIKHNPVYAVFYVDAPTDAKMHSSSSPLSDRLAATLLVVITLAYQEGGWVTLDRVRKFRRKSFRGIMADLRELQAGEYVEIDQENKRVKLGPRASFELDYERFFAKLSERRPDEP